MTALITKLSSAALLMGALFTTAAPTLAHDCDDWYREQGEVFRRDNGLNREIYNDRGFLRGYFGQLRSRDQAIYRQAQYEAMRNGGYLTPGQIRRLNREENALQRQINYDHRWF